MTNCLITIPGSWLPREADVNSEFWHSGEKLNFFNSDWVLGDGRIISDVCGRGRYKVFKVPCVVKIRFCHHVGSFHASFY